MTVAGLGYAVQHIRQNARYPDTELAHISPQEVALFDAIQGRKVRNPKTGLPEYGLLGDILQAVLSVGGFMLGGPLGAAAGSGIGSAINGGDLKQILESAALSGAGGELGQGLTGGGWNPIGGSLAGSTGAAAGTTAGTAAGAEAGALPTPEAITQAMNAASGQAATAGGSMVPGSWAPAGMAAAPGTVPASAAQGLLAHIGGWGGAGAGLGALASVPMPSIPTPAAPQDNFRITPLGPLQRHATPYPGDPLTYGQTGGEWNYFGPTDYPGMAHGGTVHRAEGGILRQNMLPLHRLRAMSRVGYSDMMAHGGSTHNGPVEGPGSGRDDRIPAMLSSGEHVVDAKTVASLGGGDNAEGQRRLYRLRKLINDKAGYKHSERLKAPRAMPSDGALLKKAMG